MAYESIHIGNLEVKNQVIGIADEVEVPLMDDVDWDGILGLAFPNDNLKQKHIDPLVDNIMK